MPGHLLCLGPWLHMLDTSQASWRVGGTWHAPVACAPPGSTSPGLLPLDRCLLCVCFRRMGCPVPHLPPAFLPQLLPRRRPLGGAGARHGRLCGHAGHSDERNLPTGGRLLGCCSMVEEVCCTVQGSF